MITEGLASKEMLARARRLVEEIEKGNEEEIDKLLDELTYARETGLFQELGKLTRELHSALGGFRLDVRISDLMERDIPDARERLSYVITMTEQAAHRTLNAVEESLPLSDSIQKECAELDIEWGRFMRREMQAAEFRELSKRLAGFITMVEENTRRIHGNLSDVLMAQDYQDLTGQMIRRVINLVQTVEDNLVELIRISGQRIKIPTGDEAELSSKHELDGERGQSKSSPVDHTMVKGGPPVPGQGEASGVVAGQDDVDELLSSLGF